MTEYKHTQDRLDEVERKVHAHDFSLSVMSDQLRMLAKKLELEVVASNDVIEQLEKVGHIREKK